MSIDDFCINRSVVVRSGDAGIWCGTLKRKDGDEVVLENARRMWSCWCAESISLSAIVVYGINQRRSRICAPVPEVWMQVEEIMPISGKPLESIMEAEIAKAEELSHG